MMQNLREQTQSTGFKVLVVAIIIVLTFFGFGATNIFSSVQPSVATVGDFDVTENVLANETERERRRVLAQMGPDFDADSIDRLQLQNYALEQLINRQVAYQAAEALGIQVSAQSINTQLLSSPAYQIDGSFNEAMYLQQVQMLGYTPPQFVEELGRSLAGEQLRRGVADSAFVSDWEVAETLSVLEQRRDVAYLTLDIEEAQQRVEVSEDAIQTRYQEESIRFQTPRTVDAEFLVVSVDELMKQVPAAAEQELQDIYDADREASLTQGERDSAHILVLVNEQRDDAAALALTEQIAAQLAAGEEFATLAGEYSEDPGSAAQGGELGVAGKGIYDQAFEDALWALEEPGALSGPVRSEYGYHLIKLNDIVETEYPSFDEQRERIAAELARDEAESIFVETVDRLERLAYEERYSLLDTAAEMGMTVQTLSGLPEGASLADVAAENVMVPGLIPLIESLDFQDALFSEEVIQGENSPLINIDDDRALVLRVNEVYPAEQLPLAQVRDQLNAELGREMAQANIELAAENALLELRGGAAVGQVAASLGASWQTQALMPRSGLGAELAPELVEEAFALPRPMPGEQSFGSVDLPQGVALLAVSRVVAGDANATLTAQVEQLKEGLSGRAQRVEFTAFFATAEADIGVQRP